MNHDFDSGSSRADKYKETANSSDVINLGTHKEQRCNKEPNEGFMDYGGPQDKWSVCSAFDFLQRYRNVPKSEWCMETISVEEACGPQPPECNRLLILKINMSKHQ